ncbi:Negative regulator of flagellin synthesis, anti-sigma-28 factor FlgM [uncultured Desulfobacterium sp.]|uniref:Negative regulator of flagellin synthesis n=1 Tax=uncultured Desulfobacterium sp. TaxID=201089 RepID=A0A445MVB3_9BACT|nr:Negative regulator of flagellin synthesis, anti-sigma-28 factor FlgM [uncultured Desulfobacterium sp.]
MEISEKIPPLRIDAYLNNVKDKNRVGATTPQPSDTAEKYDKVELSQAFRDVNKAKEELASIHDIRTEKVDEIKKQINDGTYKIDGNKIAFNMVRQSIIDEIV